MSGTGQGAAVAEGAAVHWRRVAWRVVDWPPADQAAWAAAQRTGDFLEPDGAAAAWRPASIKAGLGSYGRWLAFLARHDLLDVNVGPGERVTAATIGPYIEDLRTRCAPVTVASTIATLGMMIQAMAPQNKWDWFWRLHARLKRRAKPSRNKRARIVPAGDLMALGLELMATAEALVITDPLAAALAYRDGLMISLLIACPLRHKNLIATEIGTHLISDADEDGYWLSFTADEMKGKRDFEAPVPAALGPALGRYLSQHRPVLLSQRTTRGCTQPERAAADNRLWLTQYGQVFSPTTMLKSLRDRTTAKFGHHINVHLFRDCSVTTVAIHDPAHVRIAQNLLGHASMQATEKNYIAAHSREALGRYHDLVLAMTAQDPADFDDEEWDDPTRLDAGRHDRKNARQSAPKSTKPPRKE